jgi:superfamily II DNA or RNA helicase
MVSDLSLDGLPMGWVGMDFVSFSSNKVLFDYQREALENALKGLYLYFSVYKGNKEEFLKFYNSYGLVADLSYFLSVVKDENGNEVLKVDNAIKYLLEYDEYPIKDGKISFECFINRMSFWMATGSGKSIVIIKLLELLGYLIGNDIIPKKDILFLTCRDDLLDQFKEYVNEFNNIYNSTEIRLTNLKDYAKSKYSMLSHSSNVINVYFYRSDLISDVQKEKTIDYRNYDNGGDWYIILDEAHKGDREESKRQMFYNILSRNGFMFNFSATFTDIRDYVTCVYNFNLSRFIDSGYGKRIYISKESVSALENKDGLMCYEKQEVVLKVFILQSALNILYKSVLKFGNLYHKPLLLTLVNSVNTDDSDLKFFFKEVEKIALGNVDAGIFNRAKEGIINELKAGRTEFDLKCLISDGLILDIIKSLSFKDIILNVFNSGSVGSIEVVKIPNNNQELIFKVKSSDRAFALIKIGDISNWLKENLSGYEIIERFEDDSIFKGLNINRDINILMGSRSFYEGWDSNRPNILLFINIGKGSECKKFVLQSIGRGVRIEPLKNKRRRAFYLYDSEELDVNLFNSIKGFVDPLETLFIFGTKANNLKVVVDTLKDQRQYENIVFLSSTNKSKERQVPKQEDLYYYISEDDFNNVRNYFNFLGDKIVLIRFNIDLDVLCKLKEEFNKGFGFTFRNPEKQTKIDNLDLLLKDIIKHFTKNKSKNFSLYY